MLSWRPPGDLPHEKNERFGIEAGREDPKPLLTAVAKVRIMVTQIADIYPVTVAVSRPEELSPRPQVVKPKLKDLKRRAIIIEKSIGPEKNRDRFNQEQPSPAAHTLYIAVILFGVFGTLGLLMYLARPWEDNFAPGTASGYRGLLGFLFWAIAPYLPLLVWARKSHAVRAVNLLRLIGAAIICVGGVGIYLDAGLRHPAPLSALVFLAVPLYQWVAVVLLMVMDYFFKKPRRKENR